MAELLNDEEYSAFQSFLAANPLHGDVIQGTGGLRKIRWSTQQKGKSGGVRIIYYYLTPDEQIRLIYIYPKSIKDNLSAKEKALLRSINERWI